MTNYIEQLKFRFIGRTVPVFRIARIDEESGRVLAIQSMGKCQDNANTLKYAWENMGYTKEKDAAPIARIDEKGNEDIIWFVSPKGQTTNIYTKPWKGPANENVIGSLLSIDILAIAMQLYPSMRDKMIFMFVGIFLGWLIVGPMITQVFS